MISHGESVFNIHAMYYAYNYVTKRSRYVARVYSIHCTLSVYLFRLAI